MNILLIEDEKPIRLMLEFALKREGYNISEADSWKEADKIICSKTPDLILLDWMLPDTSGIDILKILKHGDKFKHIPIIMLTAITDESHKILGLDSGADDYITKPFSPNELIARIQAVLRRSNADNKTLHDTIEAGDLKIDKTQHEVFLGDKVVDLGPTEFRLLVFMLENPNRVFSRGSLLNQVWSRSAYVEERTVDVHILRLRKALSKGNYDKYIQTVRGIGYRFAFEESKLGGVA